MTSRFPAHARAIVILCCSIVGAGAWLAYRAHTQVARAAATYLDSGLAAGYFSGTALIARDGRILFERGYGQADHERGTLNDAQTVFQIGSITKTFTATLVMQLAEQGKLDTGASVCDYLQDCPAHWRSITIAHLLSHTSGMPADRVDDTYLQRMQEQATPGQLLRESGQQPLDFEPGAEFRYSNAGYNTLGAVIEQVTRKPYAEVLRENILDPLDMQASGIGTSGPALARGYVANDAGGADLAPDFEPTRAYAAGAMYSTVADLLRWDQALYTDRLLPQQVLERMWTPVREHYGLGWGVRAISQATAGHRQVMHGGRVPGFIAGLFRFPDDRVTIIVLSNVVNTNVEDVAGNLAAIVFGQPARIPTHGRRIRLDARAVEPFVGRYRWAPGITLEFSAEGDELLARLGNQPPVRLYPEAATKFFALSLDAQVWFDDLHDGKTQRVTVRYGGEHYEAPRER
ncbi:MAG TPA: serine hydrolase [Povalibacter sp.]|uniref:serine hydrolase n=1 Tax=Povalibacter sp. TaxID=1962978 RepID=UPI002C361752|nr:serine hydrolase [Povalibacter sp.]HMN43515.1 serine hydrolase [Povalibacter sp.]